MGAIEEGGKVASGIVESLKSQPLALALVIINVLYLFGGLWFLHGETTRQERRSAFVQEILRACESLPIKPPKAGD